VKTSRLGLIAGLAALFALPMPADDPQACPAIDPPAFLRPGSGGQAALLPGLRAFRDPVTGELRKPTAEEAAALAQAEAEAAPERQPVFEVVVHPDGMKSVDLQGAFTSAAVATRNPDGSITVRCVPAGAPSARQAHEEK
jgi:hypothetical protein